MRFSRARYVTLCQQSLVTAAVLAVGLSAAGVKTLDIVPQPGATAGAREGASEPGAGAAPGATQQTLADGARTVQRTQQQQAADQSPEKSQVDTAPVTPKVREVAVTSPPPSAARRISPSPKAQAPQSRAPRTPAPRTTTPKSQGATAPVKPGFVESAPQQVQGYATVGVTWQHGVSYRDDQISVQIRTEKNGTWSHWMVDHFDSEEGPSQGAEGDASSVRPGTDPLVIGDVDRVQMRAQTTNGTVPPDLRLAIVDPGTGKMTTQGPAIDTAKLPSATKGDTGAAPQASGTTTLQGDGVSDAVTLSAMKPAPKPYIYSRAQWGANEKMREQSPPDYGTVKTGFIHHTVNANNYTRDQVPALLRGIYAYHTQSRGWRDIGYNYLVDRFGRIWEGRWGGVDRAVVGAHTLGYNEVSFAMSAIGNFDIAQPPAAVAAAYARLFAWKLSLYDIRANNPRILVKGRYLQAINGHRDVGQTACPGRYLYAQIPSIRTAARNIQLAAQGGGSTPPPPPPPPPAPVFTSPTQAPQPAQAQPSTMTFPKATNLVGSAYPDLVMKSRRTGAIRVLPTGGQTGFRGTVTSPGGWSSMNLVAAVGDVTGDGRGDVLGRARRTGLTRIYHGDGAGHVAVSGTNATRQFRVANLLVGAGDWNGDGRNDVLMRTRASGTLYYVAGYSNGKFGSPHLLSKGWGGYTSTAVAGDLTGDGLPDIVAVKAGRTYVVPGVAGHGLGTPVARRTLGSGDTVVGGARDLSGDGIGDVVVHSRSGALRILAGGPGGLLLRWLGPFDGGAGLSRLSAGQMAGGAQPDVVGTAGKNLVVVVSNGLVNTTATSLATNLRVKGATQLLSVGDWNRDGKSDVITREGGGDTLWLHLGAGNGTLGAGVLMSKGWASFTNLSAVGDVTGDKFPDLMGKTAKGAMTVFPGNGKTSFLAPRLAPASLRTFNQVASGSPWKSAGLPGSAFLSSDGSFVPYGGTSGAGDLSGYDWVVGPGDVDGNGVADLVARDSSGTLWLLPGTSQGYLERRFLAAGYAGYSLGG